MAFFEGQTFQSCLLKGRNFMFQQLRNIGCSYCKEWDCNQSSTTFIGMPENQRCQYCQPERSVRQCPLLTNRPCLKTPFCWAGGDNIQCEAEQLHFQGCLCGSLESFAGKQHCIILQRSARAGLPSVHGSAPVFHFTNSGHMA